MKRVKKVSTRCALMIVSVFAGTAPGYSGEGVRPAGPIGGTDISQALLPPTGLYAAGVGVTTALTGFFDREADVLGGFGYDLVAGGGLLYVYDGKLFGGSIASSISLGIDRFCFKLDNVFDQCASGLTDAYSDIFMWSRYFPSADAPSPRPGMPPIQYGLAVMAGLGVSMPTGSYNPVRAVNIGANVWDIAPNVSATYTVPSVLGQNLGQATEFSARVWFNNYTENPDTQYQSGRILSVDFAVTQIYNEWQVGLTGTAYTQLNSDEIDGVVVGNNGNRARLVAIGPIVARKFMMLDRPYEFMIKGLFSAWGTNTVEANAVIFRLSTKVF